MRDGGGEIWSGRRGQIGKKALFQTSPNLPLVKRKPKTTSEGNSIKRKKQTLAWERLTIPWTPRHCLGGLTIGWVWGSTCLCSTRISSPVGVTHTISQIRLTLGNGTDPAFGATYGCGGSRLFLESNPEGAQGWHRQGLEVAQLWLLCWIINVHFSYPSVQQKNDKAISDNEITHIFCCSQQAFGGKSCLHLHIADWVTRLWLGGAQLCVIDRYVVHRLEWPATLLSAGHQLLMVSWWKRNLCRTSNCHFKEGLWRVSRGWAALV